MRRFADLAVVLTFILFMVAPAASLMLYGYDRMAENKVEASALDWKRLSASDDGYRREIATRFLTNSPVGMAAIRARSWLDYDVIGFVSNEQVVSGLDGWLFYAPAVRLCLPANRVKSALNKLEAMHAVAAGAGIDFQAAIIPDKSWVYPDHMGSRARIEAGCQLANATGWRAERPSHRDWLIDHGEVLKDRQGDGLLYYPTDTHWNELGQALAVRQLAQSYLGLEPDLPREEDEQPHPNRTDLPLLLRLDRVDTVTVYPAYWQRLQGTLEPGVPGSTLIVHDSFYAGIKNQLSWLFPEASMYGFADERLFAVVSARPQRLIVSTVERFLVARAEWIQLDWNGPIGRGLLAASATAAQTCTLDSVPLASLTVHNMDIDEASGAKTGDGPQILVPLPSDGKSCLELSFRTEVAEQTEIFLPVADSPTDTPAYEGGLSIKFPPLQEGKVQTVRLALPETYAGKTIRIDPGWGRAQLQNLSIRVGRL